MTEPASHETLRAEVLPRLRDPRLRDAVGHARWDLEPGGLRWSSSVGEHETLDVWLGLDPAALALLAAVPWLLEHLQEVLASRIGSVGTASVLGEVRLWWALMPSTEANTPYRGGAFRPARRDDPDDVRSAIEAWLRALGAQATAVEAQLPELTFIRLPDEEIVVVPCGDRTGGRATEALIGLGAPAPRGEVRWTLRSSA